MWRHWGARVRDLRDFLATRWSSLIIQHFSLGQTTPPHLQRRRKQLLTLIVEGQKEAWMKFSLKHGEHSFAFRPVQLCSTCVWYTAQGQRAAFELPPLFRIICSVQMTKAYIRPLHSFLEFQKHAHVLFSIFIYTLFFGKGPSKLQFWKAYFRLQVHSKSLFTKLMPRVFCLVKQAVSGSRGTFC